MNANVGDRVVWQESGEKHVFFVRRVVEYPGGKRWVQGSQTIDGEISMLVPESGLSVLERKPSGGSDGL